MVSLRQLVALAACLTFCFAQRSSDSNTISSTNSNSTSNTPAAPINGYVNYKVFTKGAPVAMIEKNLMSLTNLTAFMGKIAPSCVDAYYRYACSFAYPKCNDAGNGPIMGCTQDCLDAQFQCKNIFLMTGKGELPNCNASSPLTGQPFTNSSTCNHIPPRIPDPNVLYDLSSVPPGANMKTCPFPFLRDPLAVPGSTATTSPIYCRSGCCIPCPAQDYFYPIGWAKHGFLAADILRFISSIFSFFMMISYFVLPDKRRHPSLLILNLSVTIFLFSMIGYFSIGDPKKLQCASAVAPSTQDNNPVCAVQGALLIFSALATCCWSAALIVNLHLHTVWNSNFFTNRYWMLNILCWGYPASVMAAALGLHQVKFEFANLCLVSVDKIFALFFYPMAAVVCPAFVVHIATFFHIAKMAVRESKQTEATRAAEENNGQRRHKHMLTAVQIQWRALLLAVVSSGTVVFYWIFYFTQIHRMVSLEKDMSITNHWLECMVSPGGDQNSCVDIIADHLPPFGLMIFAESIVSMLGIWLFVIFGKRSMWREWNDLIYDLRLSWRTKGKNEKSSEQFFAL
ncbi:hypothetical protein K501DRAFT_294022 [Backusella circina FSU 941]|nr:hypothetical protein K501DRAFT_294022 [Backusella circina FSU 941]